MNRALNVGDRVIYRKIKVSSSPGVRAKHIHAAKNGENYTYCVDKFWRVCGISDNGQIEMVTRTGKRVFVDGHDSRLRRANLLERLVYSSRFPNSDWVSKESGSSCAPRHG